MENGSLIQTFLIIESMVFDINGVCVSLGLEERSVNPVYMQSEILFSSKNIIMQIVISKLMLRLEYLFS